MGLLVALLAAVHATAAGLPDRRHVLVVGSSTAFPIIAAAAERAGQPVVVRLAWLTLTVHSSLEAIGLTAAVSARLADEGIACNVLAGYHHDHLLVPVERADDAVRALAA